MKDVPGTAAPPAFTLQDYDAITAALLQAVKDAAGRNLREQVKVLAAVLDRVRANRDKDYPAERNGEQ